MARKELLVGAFVSLTDPRSVDVVASVGFDYIILDNEHGLTDPSELRECIRSAAVYRVPAVVRVSGPSLSEINKTLDSGAAGIIIPHVEDADELARVIAYTRPTPVGKRASAPSLSWLSHLQGSDPQSWLPGVIAIVESVRGVEAVDELVRVPGVSAVLAGRGDLSQDLGVERNSPKLLEMMGRVNEAVVRMAGGPALMGYCSVLDAPTEEAEDHIVEGALRAGASVIFVGPDTFLLSRACATVLGAIRRQRIAVASE
jgi:2-keto-3-deoxy-L-rhamnonate aldolase RhmA